MDDNNNDVDDGEEEEEEGEDDDDDEEKKKKQNKNKKESFFSYIRLYFYNCLQSVLWFFSVSSSSAFLSSSFNSLCSINKKKKPITIGFAEHFVKEK